MTNSVNMSATIIPFCKGTIHCFRLCIHEGACYPCMGLSDPNLDTNLKNLISGNMVKRRGPGSVAGHESEE